MTEHTSLTQALAAFQAELPKLTKNAKSEIWKDGRKVREYNYADLAELSNVVLPLLGKHGMSFTCKPTMLDGQFVLHYLLCHLNEVSEGFWPLSPGTPQQIGSQLTYLRRYILGAITGAAGDDDDDGQAASEAQRQPERPVEQEAARPRKTPADEARAQIRAAREKIGKDSVEIATAWLKWYTTPIGRETNVGRLRAFASEITESGWEALAAGPPPDPNFEAEKSLAEAEKNLEDGGITGKAIPVGVAGNHTEVSLPDGAPE